MSNNGPLWPSPRLRPSGPADWGRKVTVCIAAIANYGQSIVIATDRMLTMGWAKSDESTLKIQGIHPYWAVMFAGTVEHVAPIIRSIAVEIDAKGHDPSYSEVEQAAVKAYQARLREEETNRVLGQFGLTIEEFTATGPSRFGDTIFSQLLTEMRQVTLGDPPGLSLLIAGYESTGVPHIFSVTHPGVVQNHDIQGFWAIGSGSYGALGHLFFHSYNKKSLREHTVYHVAAAKFMAEESSSDVGKTTTLLILDWEPPGLVLNIENKLVVYELVALGDVKQIWKTGGKPRIPPKLYERMKVILGGADSRNRVWLGFKKKEKE